MLSSCRRNSDRGQHVKNFNVTGAARVHVLCDIILYDINYVYYILSGNKRTVRYRSTQNPDSE